MRYPDTENKLRQSSGDDGKLSVGRGIKHYIIKALFDYIIAGGKCKTGLS